LKESWKKQISFSPRELKELGLLPMTDHLEAVRRTDPNTDFRKCIEDPNYLQWFDLEKIQSDDLPNKSGAFIIRMKPESSVPESYRTWKCQAPNQHALREIVYLHYTETVKRLANPDHDIFFLMGG